MSRDYWARFEHFVKKLTDTCDEVRCASLRMCIALQHSTSRTWAACSLLSAVRLMM